MIQLLLATLIWLLTKMCVWREKEKERMKDKIPRYVNEE
jgi:hypothetical protein